MLSSQVASQRNKQNNSSGIPAAYFHVNRINHILHVMDWGREETNQMTKQNKQNIPVRASGGKPLCLSSNTPNLTKRRDLNQNIFTHLSKNHQPSLQQDNINGQELKIVNLDETRLLVGPIPNVHWP